MRAISSLKKIQLLGTDGLSENEKRRVVLTNSACLFLSAICFGFIFPWLLKGRAEMVMTNVLMIMFYFGLIWLNKIGYTSIPKFAVVIFVSISNFVAADMMGRASNYHFSLIPIAGFSALLFEPEEKKKILFVILLPMSLLLTLIIFDFGIFPNKMENSFTFLPIFDYVVNGIIIAVTTYYLYRSRNQAESKYKKLYEEHVNAQKDLDHVRAQAMFKSKMSSLGEMAGAITHEIKSPLGHMMNLAEIFKKKQTQGSLTPERADEITGQIIQTGLKISKIVNSLNTLYHPNSDREMREVCLKSILDDVVVICSHRLYHKSIAVEVSSSENLSKILCNQIEVGQVFINLINNAIDALEGIENAKITIHVVPTEKKLCLHFENNGPVISKEMRTKIFQNYFTTKEPGKGTGLGLSISRKLMENNGGRLFLEENTEATRFTCEFPLL